MNQELRKQVAVIGGGNGAALSLLALKPYHDRFDISAVISTSDSGGSSGRLREEYGLLPPGDLLKAILALSEYDYPMLKRIFSGVRFENTDRLNQHNLGNLFLTLAAQYGGSFISAIRALEQSVASVGRVYPATLGGTTLAVELSNGDTVLPEGAIDIPSYDRSLRILRAWLEPAAPAYGDAIRAVREADAIILGAGSLYTSIIAALLPEGIGEAIAASDAKIISVVGNTYKTDGETGPTTLSDYVRELQQYVPRQIDAVVCEARSGAGRGMMEMDKEQLKAYHVVAENLEESPGHYAPEKLGKIFVELIA